MCGSKLFFEVILGAGPGSGEGDSKGRRKFRFRPPPWSAEIAEHLLRTPILVCTPVIGAVEATSV